MGTITKSSKLSIHLPSMYRESTPKFRTRSRSHTERLRYTGLEFDDALINVLKSQEMQLVDKIELEPVHRPAILSNRQQRCNPKVSNPQVISFQLTVSASEKVVLLVEQEGTYSWQFPSEIKTGFTGGIRQHGSSVFGDSQVSFQLEINAVSSSEPRSRGVFTELIYPKVRVFVLMFIAKCIVSNAIVEFERNVQRGIVSMKSSNPSDWQLLTGIDQLNLPHQQSARILLVIHGTLSSTVDSYGTLGAYPWGKSFLEDALDSYDAVIGFDHPTLSVDPLENANNLLQGLQQFNNAYTPSFDVITFSRGGLVLRSLLERLMSHADWQPKIERVVFVAVPNGGTNLAQAKNWHTMIDWHTNITMATSQSIRLLGNENLAALIIKETVGRLVALVKYLDLQVINAIDIPGVSAMQPNGTFIKAINQTQIGQLDAGSVEYYIITSAFEPRYIDGKHEPEELPRQLLETIGSRLAEVHNGEDNDLIVDVPSMLCMEQHAGQLIKDRLDIGKNAIVYHNNYFAQSKVIDALRRWLCLPDRIKKGSNY